MKPDVHPDYHPAVFRDATTGTAFLARSTITNSRPIEWETPDSVRTYRGAVTDRALSSRSLPRSEQWDWYLRARCRGEPPEIFFPPDNERGTRRLRREENAKRICQSCPVLERCRAYAIDAPEPYGIWGATTPFERRRLRGGHQPTA